MSQFYNEKQKQAYINQKHQNERLGDIMVRRFKATAETEKALNKDVADWTAPEILDYYKSMVNRSLESLMIIHSQLGTYVKWCLANSLVEDSQNHFDEIDREILNKTCINTGYLNKCILTRQEILKAIKDRHILNDYERFLLLALFEGVGHEGYSDFQKLTMDAFEGTTLRLPNRTIKVSPELVQLAQKSSESYEYHPYGMPKRKWTFSLDDPRIIKRKTDGTLSEELSPVAFRHILSINMKRLADECNNPAFFSSLLFESGRIEMIKGYMREEKCSAEVAINRHHEEIANQYGKIYSRVRYLDKWSQFLTLTDA